MRLLVACLCSLKRSRITHLVSLMYMYVYVVLPFDCVFACNGYFSECNKSLSLFRMLTFFMNDCPGSLFVIKPSKQRLKNSLDPEIKFCFPIFNMAGSGNNLCSQ